MLRIMPSLPVPCHMKNCYFLSLLLGVLTFVVILGKVSMNHGAELHRQAIKSDARSFPQIKRWSKAGTRRPIPDLSNIKADAVLHSGSSAHINDKINQLDLDLENNGGHSRVLLLMDGTYHINNRVRLKSNIILMGQSRDGVLCVVNMTSRSAFYIGSIDNSGIYRITIIGSWGKPKYKWNIGDNHKNRELPGNSNVSVYFSKLSRDCWIDDVNILDSADFPLRCAGEHITMRSLVVNRVHNKHGGAHGYWIVLGRDNLITKSKATELRHISLQGNRSEYNVLYDNDFKQEISFHVGDLGNNLITHNRITLPRGMPSGRDGMPDYRAIMGPWSEMHEKSKAPNFLHNNILLENNHGGVRRMNDNRVYKGPIFSTSQGEQQASNFRPIQTYPKGGKLYPVSLIS